MGFFDLFKKKVSPLTAGQERWNGMWELWANGNLQSPIKNLMTYHSEVNNGGHSQYFFNVSNSGNLATEVETVLSVLPDPLRKNLKCAYTAFAAQEDIDNDTNDALFEECDDLFYENEQLIIDMIQEAADNGLDTHRMNLHSSPFEKIKSGEKTIELRLLDEKRQKIKAGDRIVFTNTLTGETVDATVAKLHCFESFEELYKSLPLLKCGYTPEDVDKAHPSDMEAYYSAEQQKQYGVVGIELMPSR